MALIVPIIIKCIDYLAYGTIFTWAMFRRKKSSCSFSHQKSVDEPWEVVRRCGVVPKKRGGKGKCVTQKAHKYCYQFERHVVWVVAIDLFKGARSLHEILGHWWSRGAIDHCVVVFENFVPADQYVFTRVAYRVGIFRSVSVGISRYLPYGLSVGRYEFMVFVWIHGLFDGVDLGKYCR